jgi:arylsulfatase A
VAGISLENVKTDGKSLVPIITGEKSVQDEIFIHYSPRWGNRVHDRWVMDGKYKLYQDGRFYDTSKDTLEKHVVESPTMEEQEIKTKFQNILDEKEQEFSFHLNDSIFKLKN